MLELRDPIEVDTPLGRGWALIVESTMTDNFWTVVLNDSKALVTFRQNKIRPTRSYSYGRAMNEEDMRKVLDG